MKSLFSFAIVLFSFLFSYTQTNVGFSKAGGLEEGVACSTQAEALTRFISGLENKKISPFFYERIAQSWVNAKKGAGDQITTLEEIIHILKWVKINPNDMDTFGVYVYKLPKGVYTFETLTLKNGVLVKGSQFTREAHLGEWVLEWWGQKIMSSWCLNLFPEVGKKVVEEPKTDLNRPSKVIDYSPDYHIDNHPEIPERVEKVVIQPKEECSCWREVIPPSPHKRRYTYNGYRIFPPNAVVIQDYFIGPFYQKRDMYLCAAGIWAPRSSYTFSYEPNHAQAKKDRYGNLILR